MSNLWASLPGKCKDIWQLYRRKIVKTVNAFSSQLYQLITEI